MPARALAFMAVLFSIRGVLITSNTMYRVVLRRWYFIMHRIVSQQCIAQCIRYRKMYRELRAIRRRVTNYTLYRFGGRHVEVARVESSEFNCM